MRMSRLAYRQRQALASSLTTKVIFVDGRFTLLSGLTVDALGFAASPYRVMLVRLPQLPRPSLGPVNQEPERGAGAGQAEEHSRMELGHVDLPGAGQDGAEDGQREI